MAVPADVERRIGGAPLSAHLATSVDDRPHVAPVWYHYDAGTLWFTTGGRKLENIRANPRVAVSIERADDGDVAWGVFLLGTARLVDDEERLAAVLESIDETYGADHADDVETAEDSDWALVAVEVASATLQEY